MTRPNNTGKGLFLDRDGTLIIDKNYLSDPDGVELIPGAREGLKLALQSGYILFLFTNQSGIGRGFYTLKEAEACNQRMIELLSLGETVFREICIAPEHPDEEQVYRKPSPRFILEMIKKHRLDSRKCLMVGDRQSDADAGAHAGIESKLVSCNEPFGFLELIKSLELS